MLDQTNVKQTEKKQNAVNKSVNENKCELAFNLE